MMKGFLACAMTVILSTILAPQAFAAEINGNEQAIYDEFCAVVEKHRPVLGDEVANTYESQARGALLQLDLDATACSEFSKAVRDVDTSLAEAHADSHAEMMKCVGIIAKAGAPYGIQVSMAADGTMSILANGSKVADTSDIVRQTGFDLGQTVAVAMAAIAVLAGALVAGHRLSVPAAA